MLDPVDPPYRMYHVSYGLSCFLQSPLFCHGLSQSFSTIVYFPISNNLIHSFNNNYTYAFNLGSHVLQSISFLQLVKYSYICTSESPILWRWNMLHVDQRKAIRFVPTSFGLITWFKIRIEKLWCINIIHAYFVFHLFLHAKFVHWHTTGIAAR